MTAFLSGSLEVKTQRPVQGEPVCVQMTITNTSDHAVEIINPETGVPAPELDWKASNEAYKIALLSSYAIIKITFKDINNKPVESKGLMPWVTPVLGKRTLQPHDSLVLGWDLNEMYSITETGQYTLQVRYGDDKVYAEAETDIVIKPHDGKKRPTCRKMPSP